MLSSLVKKKILSEDKNQDNSLTNRESKGRANEFDFMVARRLKSLRLIRGYSQEIVGNAIGVSVQQLQKYETGKNRISSGKLHQVAQFFNVLIGYFYEDSNESHAIASILAEDAEEYDANLNHSKATEKEVIALVKAFGDIKNYNVRKKFVDLVKVIS